MHQKGNAVIIIVIIIAVILGGGYWYITSNPSGKQMLSKVTGTTLKPYVNEKDFAFINDPAVRKHFVAQLNTNGYRIKSVSSGKGGYDIMEYQIHGNDVAYHTISHDGDKELSNMIVIGDTTYLKDPADNTWWKQVAKPALETSQEPAPEKNIQEEIKNITEKYSDEQTQVTYKNLGQEPCGGLTCFKYEEVNTDNPDSKRTFWFDTKEYLLRKEEYGFGEFKSTNEYDYSTITVTAPTPTKDVPPGKSIYEMMQQNAIY